MSKVKGIDFNHGTEKELLVNTRIENTEKNKGQQMEKVEKETVLDTEQARIDTDKKELSTDYLLECAEYYVFEAITSHVPTEIYEKFDVYKNYYYDIKRSSTEAVPESIIRISEMAMKNMCEINKIIVEETKKYLEIREGLFALAREVYQNAVKAAVTSDDLIKCAKAIEINLDNKEWADQILKRVK